MGRLEAKKRQKRAAAKGEGTDEGVKQEPPITKTCGDGKAGGSDENLSATYKGPHVLVCGAERLLTLELVTLQIIYINLLLLRPKYLSTLTRYIISFLGFVKLF